MLHVLYPQSWWWWILPTKGEWVEIAHECCWCFPGDSPIWCGIIQHPPLWTHVEVECPGCVQNTRGPQWFPELDERNNGKNTISWAWFPVNLHNKLNKPIQWWSLSLACQQRGSNMFKVPQPAAMGGLSRLVPLSSDHPDRSFSSVLRAAEFMMCLGTLTVPAGMNAHLPVILIIFDQGYKGV